MRCKQTFEGIPLRLKGKFVSMVLEVLFKIVLDYESNKFNSMVVAIMVLMIVREQFNCDKLLPHFFEELTEHSEEIYLLC